MLAFVAGLLRKCTRPRQIGVPALATHGGLFYPAVFSRKDTPFRLPLFSSPKIVQRGFFTLGVPRAKRGESNTLFIVPGRFLHGTEALIHMSLICMTECRNIIRPRSVESGMDYILDIRVEIRVTTSAYQFCEIKL